MAHQPEHRHAFPLTITNENDIRSVSALTPILQLPNGPDRVQFPLNDAAVVQHKRTALWR